MLHEKLIAYELRKGIYKLGYNESLIKKINYLINAHRLRARTKYGTKEISYFITKYTIQFIIFRIKK